MPTETRVVSFSNAEVIDSLVDYCEKTNRELPQSGIKRLAFSNDSEIKVTAEFDGGAPPMRFYENEVAVALILFCNKKGIPVARRAIKSLQIGQDTISLHLAIRT
ncbi:MAG TPA: hypothetical protein VN823_12620 [Stellaceae bacterium]|nr:hypothetical protein [Stellaceae bacterium]